MANQTQLFNDQRAFRTAVDTGDLETAERMVEAGILQTLRPEAVRDASDKMRQIQAQREKYTPSGLGFLRQQGATTSEIAEQGFGAAGISGIQEETPVVPGSVEAGQKPLPAKERAQSERLDQVGAFQYLKETGVIKGDDFEAKRVKAVSLADQGEGRRIKHITRKLERGESLTPEEQAFREGKKQEKAARPSEAERLSKRASDLYEQTGDEEAVQAFYESEGFSENDAKDRASGMAELYKKLSPQEVEKAKKAGLLDTMLGWIGLQTKPETQPVPAEIPTVPQQVTPEPSNITEENIQHTMEVHGLSRDEVLRRLGR